MEMTDNEFREETDRIWRRGYESAEKDLKPKLDATLVQNERMTNSLNKIHDLAGQIMGPESHPNLGAIQDWVHQVLPCEEKRRCECVWMDCGPVGTERDLSFPCPVHDKRIGPSPKKGRICAKCGGDHLEALTCQERNGVYER